MMTNHSEYCLICSSLNHLVVNDHCEAWECWNCHARYWLDDQARLEYMVHNDRSFAEAEQDLINPLTDISPYFAMSQGTV